MKYSRAYLEKKAAALEAKLSELRDAIAVAPPSVERHWATPKGDETRSRVAEFIAKNRCRMPTLEEIGEACGITRERVRQLAPEYGRERRELRALQERNALAKFIQEHPEAQLTKPRGGWADRDIARELGLTMQSLRAAWIALELPDKRLLTLDNEERWRFNYERNREKHIAATQRWAAAHPERVKEIQKRAVQKYVAKLKATVLRQETCANCGTVFDWTLFKEKNRDKDTARGMNPDRPIVCCAGCGGAFNSKRRVIA